MSKRKIAAENKKTNKVYLEPLYFHIEPLSFDKKERIFFIILILFAFITRFYRLSYKSFWIDEYGTYIDALSIFTKDFYTKTHFLAFMLVNLSTKFGYNEFFLRLPSCLAGALTVPLMYLLAKRAFNNQIAVITSILVLLSPYQIHFAHEARYYTQMTFLSALMLYFLILQSNKFRILNVILILLLGIISYGIHPATAAYTGSVILILIYEFLRFKQYRHIVNTLQSNKLAFLFYIISGIFIVVILFILKNIFFFYFKNIWNRLILFPHIPFTPGVEFNFNFFLNIFKKFPVNYGSPVFPYIWFIFLLYFILSLIYCIKEKKLFYVLFFFASFFIANLSLFLFQASSPFSAKYIIFLYPILFILYGVGNYYLIDYIYFLFSNKLNKTINKTILLVIVLALISIAPILDIKNIYFKGMFPTKKSLEYLTKNIEKEDIVLTVGYAEQGYTYYAPKYGIELSRIYPLDCTNKLKFSINLIKALKTNKNIWLILTVPVNNPVSKDELHELIKPYFSMVHIETSYLVPELWDHEIYRLKNNLNIISETPSRFLITNSKDSETKFSGEFPKHFDLESTSEENKKYLFSLPISASEPGEYYTIIKSLSGFAPASIKLTVDGKEYGFKEPFSGADFLVSDPVALEIKEYIFKIEADAPPEWKPDEVFFMSAEISTNCMIHKCVKSISFTNISKFIDPIYRMIDNKIVTYLDRGAFLEYEFDIEKAGDYQIAIECVNDKPAPVAVEVRLNDKYVSLLSYDLDDDSLSIKYTNRCVLPVGKYKISLFYINNYFKAAGAIEDNRVLGISEIKINYIVDENDFHPPNDITRAIQFIPVGEDLQYIMKKPLLNAKLTQTNWGVLGELEKLKIDQVGNNTVKVEIPFDYKTKFALFTPKIYKADKEYAYFDIRMKTEMLYNHSATLYIVILDSKDQIMSQIPAYITGYTGDTDWVDMPCITRLPKDASGVSFAVGLYMNGKKPSTSPGYLYLRDPYFNPESSYSTIQEKSKE